MFNFLSNTTEKKMDSISSSDYQINEKLLPKDEIKAKNIMELLADKAVLIKQTTGVYYYYNRKLIRFYKNSYNKNKAICSISCITTNAEKYKFLMENGSIIDLSYQDDYISISIKDFTSFTIKTFHLIDPLGDDQLLSFSIDNFDNYI